MVDGVIAEHGPQDVDAAAGEGEDGLLVRFTFGAFAVIEGVRLCASAGRDLGGEVHRPQQPSVVSPGTAQIPVDPSGIAGLRCQAGESCELVDAGERGHVAAGGGEEFRGQQWTETGQAHDDVGGFRVEGDHCLRKSGDHLRIVVVDNASTDGTLQLAGYRSYQEHGLASPKLGRMWPWTG